MMASAQGLLVTKPSLGVSRLQTEAPKKKTTSGVFRAKAFISLANGIWQRMSSEMLRRTDGIQWVYLVLPASPGEFLEEKTQG